MKIISIHNKKDLLEHRVEIDTLFFNCFGGRQLGKLWDWAYIENPSGEPIVTLCYEDSRLVGHYAIMPLPVRHNDKVLNTYLSMTTMVAESHRKYGLFPKLASENYKIAESQNVDFVMGFPNAMSTPGFKKRLGWTLPEADYVASINKERLFENDIASLLVSRESFSLNLQDHEVLAWRMSRPGADYEWDDGLLYKNFGEAVDVLYFETQDDLRKLPDSRIINILVKGDVPQLRDSMAFEYQFGGVRINTEFSPLIINRQLCLSDVF